MYVQCVNHLVTLMRHYISYRSVKLFILCLFVWLFFFYYCLYYCLKAGLTSEKKALNFFIMTGLSSRQRAIPNLILI